jgi:hypothetical protein
MRTKITEIRVVITTKAPFHVWAKYDNGLRKYEGFDVAETVEAAHERARELATTLNADFRSVTDTVNVSVYGTDGAETKSSYRV